MNTRNRPTLSLKMIDFDSVAGTFEGYGSVFGNLDLTGDVVERGAFAKTIRDAEERRATNGGRFLWPLLSMHDEKRPIGGITSAREDSHGLRITGLVDVGTPAGQAAYSGLKTGYTDQFSIGYDAVKANRDKAGVRHLTEIKLWEVSLITTGFAANQLAVADALSVKSTDRTQRGMERVAREMADWRSQRPALGPMKPVVRAPDYPSQREPGMPSRDEYATSEEFRAAMDAWLVKRNMRGMAREGVFQRQVEADRERRIASGTATLSERREWARAHGQLPPDSDAILRAHEALLSQLEKDGE